MTFDSNAEIWPVLPFGFDDDKDESKAGDGEQGNQSANNQGEQENSDEDDTDEYEGMSAKELRRIAKDNAKRAKDAAAEAESAKKTLTDKEREKLEERDRLKLEKEDLTTEVAKLRAENTKLLIVGAIRDDKRFEWHNPEMVAQQLDSAKVKVVDGKVEGLASALVKVAKDESTKFMLKKDNTQQDDGNQQQQNNNQQQNNGNGNGQATGFQPGQGGANSGGSMPANAAELAELMPALRTRL